MTAASPDDLPELIGQQTAMILHALHRWGAHLSKAEPPVAPAGALPVIAAMAATGSPVLADAVASLLRQCASVRIFVNDSTIAHPILDHPRVQTRRAQDWDPRGPAGRFCWMADVEPAGYRLIASDTLVYPPDLCNRLLAGLARQNGRAIVGTNGVLLRQPACTSQAPIASFAEDRTVHLLDAGAILFDSRHVDLPPDAFLGSDADLIALACEAQRQALPMVAIRQPDGWMPRFAATSAAMPSLQRNSAFTMQPTCRPKVVMLMTASTTETLVQALAAWDRYTTAHDLAFIVPWPASEVPATRHHRLPDREIHLVEGETFNARIDAALALAARLKPDLFLGVTDALRPRTTSWAPSALALCAGSGSAFGISGSDTVRLGTVPRPDVAALLCHGPVLGRAVRDAEFLLKAPTLGDLFRPDDAPALAMDRVAAFESALYVSGQGALPLGGDAPVQQLAIGRPALSIDAVFSRRVVINLDRRPDRWASVSAELRRANVTASRFTAIDARQADIAAEYDAYCRTRSTEPSGTVRPVADSLAFFADSDSQRSRIRFLERTTGGKAIGSAGAWAYLRSWQEILRTALRDRLDTILVMDDDVVFHRDAAVLFAAAVASIPEDWLILQLGTMQHHWGPEWVRPRGTVLYNTNGCAIGSHAVGLRAAVLPSLLAHVERMDMPFDVGALAATVRAFRDRAFVVRPNIAIQRIAADSDIQTSGFQQRRDAEAIAAAHRWVLADYPGLQNVE